MAKSTDARIGVTRGFSLGESGASVADALNKNARLMSVLLQMTVINHAATTPPTTPVDGDAYIIATGATGVWASHVNHIAAWDASIGSSGDWFYIIPANGLRAHSIALGRPIQFDGTAWSTTQYASVISNKTGGLIFESVQPSGSASVSARLQAGTETATTTMLSLSKADGVLGRVSCYGTVELNYANVGTSTTTTVGLYTGTGSPEGNLAARTGSMYMNRSGGKPFYKDSGTGNTGWLQL